MSLAMLALLMLAPSEAQPAPEPAKTEAQAPGQATPAAAKEEKKICRTVEDTGSRLGNKKICMTAKEWRKSDY